MDLRKDLAPLLTTALMTASLMGAPAVLAAQSDPDGVARALEQLNRRLESLEKQNQQLTQQVEELARQNETLRREPAPARSEAPVQQVASAAAPAQSNDWASHIRLGGDLRFRHDNIDNSALPTDRARDTVRARINAAIQVNESIKGEIGFASGGRDPRGGSSTLGAASSRKEIGLDLAYLSWRPIEEVAMTAGKMREPYVRPGRSMFLDNEIRPEGVAVNYKDSRGIFGNAFNFWLEERELQGDSMLRGGQIGWDGAVNGTKLKFGGGYYDYQGVQGRAPGFGNGLVNEFGNTLIGAGPAARYAYDYNIGQLFAEATFPLAGIPLNLFADYARNFAADNDLDTAYSVGLLVGKAGNPGQWEAGVLSQSVKKDALFGHWTDSDFAGGVTDNSGYAYRVAWMAMQNLLLNVTYLDTRYNVDVGSQAAYDRWQLDFNVSF